MNIKLNIIFVLSLLAVFTVNVADAQNNKKKAKVVIVDITAVVADEAGNPIANALVTANEGATQTYTDVNGSFTVKSKQGYPVVIEALGFQSYTTDPVADAYKEVFTLEEGLLFAGEDDVINLPNRLTDVKRYSVSAVSTIAGTDIDQYPDALISNTLQGRAAGLSTVMSVNGISNNSSSMYIRGLSANDSNTALVLVDGMPRDLDGLLPQEIESIEVLKDATAKILYGPEAANGVILVTTKKGTINKRVINVSLEAGIAQGTRYPEYLNSYDYATLYNEARVNDGLTPLYSDADLEGYKNSTGAYDMRYPDVDFYDTYLNNTLDYKRASIEFSGGNDNTRYALVAGYMQKGGLQAIGNDLGMTRYNVRGNLEMKVSEVVTAFVGMALEMESTKSAYIDHNTTFLRLSQTRPNEAPITISEDYIALDGSGYPAYGVTEEDSSSTYGDFMYGGQKNAQSKVGQVDFGFDFDFSNLITKGLTAKAMISFDNYFSGTELLDPVAPTYSILWETDEITGEETPTFEQRRAVSVTDQWTLSAKSTTRDTAMTGGFGYLRTFDSVHRVNASLIAMYWKSENTGTTQDLQTANAALRVNYAFNDRYMFEASTAMMGSENLSDENRWLPTWAAGAGWVMSDEDFLSGATWLDYLKLKVSGGFLGYDGSTPSQAYYTNWVDTSTARINNSLNPDYGIYSSLGNPDLQWETTLEGNIGFEAVLMNRRLSVAADYFRSTRKDIIMDMSSYYSGVYGGVYAYDNYGQVSNHGFDLDVTWAERKGDFFYSVGLNVTHTKNTLDKANEIDNYDNPWENAEGYSTDSMFGYVAVGLFGKDVDINNHAVQTLGEYGEGDIAYADLNGDDIIDSNDRKYLGNSYARYHLGLNLNFNYKGFGLYAQLTSQLGVSTWLNNSYYWVDGEDKYSTVVLDRYHPTNNPDGTYPSLTTTESTNNYVNSSFWLEDASYVRLKNVEISYTFGHSRPICEWLRSAKVFVRGTNLWTISKIKDLDPEALNAGVTNYPVLTTITGGVELSF
ncbi:MAG: SusC/RagA family TonB-linked outer membrane protein [Rikenellaceae bacterium]